MAAADRREDAADITIVAAVAADFVTAVGGAWAAGAATGAAAAVATTGAGGAGLAADFLAALACSSASSRLRAADIGLGGGADLTVFSPP